MPRLARSHRRLLILVLTLPVLLDGLEWAAESLTTTGYGRDTVWTHPVMAVYVIAVQFLGLFLVFLVSELQQHAGTPLAGKTIAEAGIRAQTGATIVGIWVRGELVRQPPARTRLDPGTILVAVGSHEAIGRLGQAATAAPRRGASLVVGHTRLGEEVAEFLRDAGEDVRVLDAKPGEGVDVVGDPPSRPPSSATSLPTP